MHPSSSRFAGKSHAHERPRESVLGHLLQSALFGALCGLLSSVPLLFAASAICYATADPAALTLPAALVVLCLSALATGICAVRRHRAAPLAVGALGGVFLALVLFTLSLLLRSHAESTLAIPLALGLRAAVIPVSALGGCLGLPRKTHKKRRGR